jgi:copper chaperone CopZ
MKQFTITLVLLFALASCSSEVEGTPAAHEETVQTDVVPNRVLTMEIEGMVCEMGCGASIRKELVGLGGISTVEFDFEEDRASNTAKIAFDKDQISVDQIVKAVSAINKGQFNVGKYSSETLEENHVSHEASEGHEESTQAEIKSVGFEIPNLLDFFAEIM